jgi:hypothetical protein
MGKSKFQVGDRVVLTKSGSVCVVQSLPKTKGPFKGLYNIARVDSGKEMCAPESGLLLLEDLFVL